MKSKFAQAVTLFIILALIAIPVSARPGSQSSAGRLPRIDVSQLRLVEKDFSAEEVSPANPKTGVVNQKGQSIYLVRLQDAPLAAYKGGITGLAATNPSVLGQKKLDVNSPASQAYLSYLADRQKAVLGSIDKMLNRSVDVVYRYVSANNGMALYLTPSEAAQIQKLPEIIYVEPDSEQELHTDAGPEWIGAPSIWDGTETGGLPRTLGEGIVVGVIDTGINPSNPSFAEVGGDGYVFTNPRGHYYGVCDPTNPSYDPTFPCNDKLIGAWGYATVNSGDPRDNDGHGSHTSSTAAGNFVDAMVVGPTLTITRPISGVAPHANLIAYAACCTNSALSAAIDQIVLDSVDVVNYSIGSTGCTASPDPWADFDAVGYLNAREAGIFVATSAGNCGPGDFTVGSPADVPWVTSVGATTHNRKLVNALVDMAGGDTTPPGDIYGKSFTSGYGPAEIVYAGDYGDALCLTPFAAGTFDGQIVVCDRGTNGRVEKGSNVKAGGAGGYILANDAASGASLNGDAHELPAVHITYDDGLRLKEWLQTGANHTGTILGTQIQEDPAFADILASFSSRGGNKALADILVPSVTAPGVDILAALGTGDSVEWGFESGTSMASPHTAGAGALLMSLHPEWTPAEIQSALMTTAYEGVLNDDGVTPATAFQRGSGRIDLTKAGRAGLVLDETIAHYWESDPSTGGDPKTLNLASMADGSCFQNCDWTRTFKSTLAYTATYQITATAEDPGVQLSLSKSEVTVAPGGSFALDVMADVVNANPDEWHFGELVLSDVKGLLPAQHLPIAAFSTGSSDTAVFAKTVSAAEVTASSIVTYTLALQNTAPLTTTFKLTDTLPAGAAYVKGSVTGGLAYQATAKQFTWQGELGPSGINISTADMGGYLSLANFVSPFSLPSDPDDGGFLIPGLDFYYHGDHYTSVIWSVNGTLEAGTASGVSASSANQDLPDPALPNNLLAPWWRDLDLTDAGHWYAASLQDNVSGDTFTVFEWEDVPVFGNPAATATFQVWIMDGTDLIWFTYAGTPMLGGSDAATVGAEDALGVAGTSYYYNGTGILPGNTTDLLVNYFNSPPKVFSWNAILTGTTPDLGVTNIAYASDGNLDYAAFVHTAVNWIKVHLPLISK